MDEDELADVLPPLGESGSEGESEEGYDEEGELPQVGCEPCTCCSPNNRQDMAGLLFGGRLLQALKALDP